MTSKTFNQGEKGIVVKHKESGLVYKSDGCDFFSYNAEAFEELGRTDHCTAEQRADLIILMQAKGKDIVSLLDKYKKKSLKEFSYKDMERLIGFLS